MGDFRDLKAWQEAKLYAKLSAAAIKKLPSYERYALCDQWRRAAYSVVLNLASEDRRGRQTHLASQYSSVASF